MVDAEVMLMMTSMKVLGFALMVTAGAMLGCDGGEPEEVTKKTQGLFSYGGPFWDNGHPGSGYCNNAPVCTYGDGVGNVTMHCCPAGYAMQGAHFSTNSFRCVKLMESQYEQNCRLDRYTGRNGMKACPEGSYLKGHSVATNTSVCCNYLVDNVPWMTEVNGDNEPATQAYGATINGACPGGVGYGHACKPNQVMVGIHIGNNDFLCEE